MNQFTKIRNMIRMMIAFRQCGLINAWRMATETTALLREEIDIETVRLVDMESKPERRL